MFRKKRETKKQKCYKHPQEITDKINEIFYNLLMGDLNVRTENQSLGKII